MKYEGKMVLVGFILLAARYGENRKQPILAVAWALMSKEIIRPKR